MRVARVLAGACVLVSAATARAAPEGRYIAVPGAAAHAAAAPSSTLIYLHRCPSSGCVIHFGTTDDSRTETSSIADGDRTIGAFGQGDQVWSDLVDCVKTTYSPFGVTVTDVDPGNVPHYENVVGGQASDLRDDISNAGGVAPFDCAEIPNGISYTFDVYGPDPVSLCWTVSQETAHVFGLDHEYLSPDPMTYLHQDFPKRFQDVDAQCGEFTARACQCPGARQSSYREILALFGPGAPITPMVAIVGPLDGATVQPGFTVTASATSIVRIDHVELYIDGVLSGTALTSPYTFQPDLTDLGEHQLMAKAIDVQGTAGAATSAFELAPPCTRDQGCTGAYVCVSGLCIPGPQSSGGLGAECDDNSQCIGMECADGGGSFKHCVASCDLGNPASCPHGFACEAAGAGGVCYPQADSGCCDASGSPAGALALGTLVGVLALRRRRRS